MYKLVLIFQLIMGTDGVSVSTVLVQENFPSYIKCADAGRMSADNYQENNLNLGYQTISWTCVPLFEGKK